MEASPILASMAITFFIFFAALIQFGVTQLLSIPFLYSAIILSFVSFTSHPSVNLPILFSLKNSNGCFPIWSTIIFSPYLFIIRGLIEFLRSGNGEEPYTEVVKGLYVGGWPSSPERLPPGEPAIVDCTFELPRKLKIPAGRGYLCVPTWDDTSPDPARIESAVKWACEKRKMNTPVFVHCAFGHGRSVTVMCALLVALGVAEDWKNAEKLIREKRPHINLNPLHRKALEEWSKHSRSSPPKTI